MTTGYTVLRNNVSVDMQDKRHEPQAHVGQHNSINALQIKIQKLKCTVH